MNIYRIIKPYTSHHYGAITLPIGTILEWFEQNKSYLSHPVQGHCVPVSKWAVESWNDYFEIIKKDERQVITMK
jgi:hypothetical protein